MRFLPVQHALQAAGLRVNQSSVHAAEGANPVHASGALPIPVSDRETAPMSPREVVQSRSMKARRSIDGALIGFIVAVATAIAVGGSGILH